nr:hypothetical protein [Armatimonadota bacterium]
MRAMTRFALAYEGGPVAVRYPRGGSPAMPASDPHGEIKLGQAETLRFGDDVALIALGAGVEIALAAADLLAERGVEATVLNARFCRPLDEGAILDAARRCGHVVTVEDGVIRGGFGSAVLELLAAQGVSVPVSAVGLPDQFVEHGPIPVLRDLVGLTAEDVAAKALDLLESSAPVLLSQTNGHGRRTDAMTTERAA